MPQADMLGASADEANDAFLELQAESSSKTSIMAQPDISQILAALAQQNQGGAAGTPQQPPYAQPPPVAYGLPPSQSPAVGAGYLPQPTSTGSVDLSQIKPTSSGAVSIADAIAKAKSIAANRGVASYDGRAADPRRGFRSRSRSRSPGRRDGYGNPYRDERRDDSRRGSGNYRRTPSPDRGRGYGGGDSNVETIRVKSSLVGLIIGRNGENLRRVESESGARVQFVQARDAQQTERQCTITGPIRAREDAKQAIYTIIEENGGSNIMNDKNQYNTSSARPKTTTNPPALRDGEHTEQMMVPDKTVGLIIGRGGETIKDVQERSGCHVNIVGENKSINGMRPVNLIGSLESTRVAKELILEIVDSDSRAQAAAGGGSGSGSNNVGVSRDRGYDQYGAGRSGDDDAYEEKTIKVPSEAVGMIIGKGGETIKELQRTSGAKINVNQPKPPDITRDVDLSGTRRALALAEKVIWEKVRTVRDRDEAAGRGGGGRSSNYDSAPQQSYGYSQPPQQAAAPGYGAYPGSSATPAQPTYPYYQQQAAPAAAADTQPAQMDPALYAQLYAQYMAQLAAQGQQPPPQ